jgi:hypothetical protein
MEIDDIQRIETPKNPPSNDPNNDINSTSVQFNDTPQGKSNFSF